MNKKPRPFKSLKREWYKKLKDSGFKDIENENEVLKQNSTNLNSYYDLPWEQSQVYHESKQEYYRLAGHFLHEYQFKNNLHKEIWRMHAEGISMKEIYFTFKRGGVTYYRNGIFKVITKLTKEMKRMYLE